MDDDLRRGVERMANSLVSMLDEAYEEARQLPRWRPAPARRLVVIRLIGFTQRYLHEWCDAFDI